MPRRGTLSAIFVGLLLGGTPACGPPAGGGGSSSAMAEVGPPAVAAGPPRVDSIVLITVDTLRWDALGFSGRGDGVTPHLDRLARAGRVYRRAHAHNVVTLPSHANILTGLYPYQHGVRDNLGFVLPDSVPTAATLLAPEGFATAAFIGAFPLDGRFGLDRDFDLYDDELPEGVHPTEMVFPERRGDEVVARALTWWRAHSGRRRFLWVHLFDPHAPYAPPAPFAERFADDPYLGEVAATDAFLGPLIDLFLAGSEPDTLIAFTADHGEALGDHGELTHGLFAYEATLRVPLVLWHPGIGPAVTDEPARHVDLLPTILEAAGVAPAPDLPGRSLLRPRSPEGQGGSYFEALSATLDRGWAPLRGSVVGEHKFIALPLPELYDLTADAAEQDNLVGTKPELADAMTRQLPEESVWPPSRGAVSADEEAALRALGYLGGTAGGKHSFSEQDDPKRLVHLDQKMHQVVDLYQRGRLTQAAAVAAEVARERPDMGIAYYYQAQALLEAGDLSAAIEVMTRAQRLGVATPALTRQLGMSLAEAGQTAEAVELLRPLASDGDPEALNAFGLVLSEAGDQRTARAVLERVFQHDPRNAVAHQHLALVALRRQDWSGAREHANQALAMSDGLPLAWNYLGTALYNLHQPRDALDAWDRALAIEPDNLDVLYNVSVIAMEVGDRSRARRALEVFIAQAPPERYGPDIQRARELLRQLGN